MTDYILQINNILEQGTPVIFYTVGSGTFGYIRELKNRFGKKPTAVCDGDVNKQGKTYRGLEGIQVIAPQEALERYPNGLFLVCSLDYQYQIIGYLTESCGVSPERIINYTPVKKVRSCSFLQKAVFYDQNGDLKFCCRDYVPRVATSENIETAGKEFLELRNKLLYALNNPQSGIQTACDNCPQICEEYYPEKPLSWLLNYFCYSHCNYKCSYCTLRGCEDSNFYHGEQPLGALLEKFQNIGLLSPEYRVILSTAGEPSIHPKRKEFYDAFNGIELAVNTNGYIFDKDLYHTMQNKRVVLVCSIDAGTRETYAKIKGVDGFAQVKENMQQYSEANTGIVALKYIFIPGVNDTIADVDGFIDFCKNTKIVFVIAAIDFFSIDKITQRTRDMIQRLKQGLSQYDIFCVPYTAFESIEYSNVIRELLL